MRVNTNELTRDALDWAVATCEGFTDFHRIPNRMAHEPQFAMMPPRREYGACEMWEIGYSTDWRRGGEIIEREKIGVYTLKGVWSAHCPVNNTGLQACTEGSTPLVAAMRCYVASKLGDEVEVPDELMQEVTK